MKIREGFVLNEIADTAVAIYIGEDENTLKGIIKLNRLGVFLWEQLEEDCTEKELVTAVTHRYDVDQKTSENDIRSFLTILRESSILEE